MDDYYNSLIDNRLSTMADYRQTIKKRHELTRSMLSADKYRHMIAVSDMMADDIRDRSAITRGMARNLDDDIHVLDRELKDRQLMDDDLWQEQLALQRSKEMLGADKYMDSLDDELRRLEQDRSEARDFMKYIVSIDSHYSSHKLGVPSRLRVDRHMLYENDLDESMVTMKKGFANTAANMLDDNKSSPMDELRGDKRGQHGVENDEKTIKGENKKPNSKKSSDKDDFKKKSKSKSKK